MSAAIIGGQKDILEAMLTRCAPIDLFLPRPLVAASTLFAPKESKVHLCRTLLRFNRTVFENTDWESALEYLDDHERAEPILQLLKTEKLLPESLLEELAFTS